MNGGIAGPSLVSVWIDLARDSGTKKQWHEKVSVFCETVPPAGSAAEGTGMDVLHVDCDTCVARGIACSDCVVTVLLDTSGRVVDLDPDEQAALQALAGSGLVPPLRLIPGAREVRDVQPPRDWRDYA
jgi:hypothetical protein